MGWCRRQGGRSGQETLRRAAENYEPLADQAEALPVDHQSMPRNETA
jgi:hypothetical protein